MTARIEFTKEQLQTEGGVLALNNMMRFLYEKIVDAGEGVDIVAGYGSPENVVAKKVGSIYMRLDGGANTSVYIKESGDDDTGWQAK